MVKKFYKIDSYDARDSIGHLIRTGSNYIMPKIEALFAEKDLTFIQYSILMNLRFGLAGNCGELCQNLRHDSGALTRVLDQLEKRGLVERQRCKTDRRVVKLLITDKGFAVTETVLPLLIDQYNEWLEDFTREEAETLVMLLNKLLKKVKG